MKHPPAPRVWRLLRLLLFAIGVVSILWFFFSFIGVLIDLLLFAFSRDPRWRSGPIWAEAGGPANSRRWQGLQVADQSAVPA